MLRAIRLVVDTGFHYKRWTRDQVVQFFHDHSGSTRSRCRARPTATSSGPARPWPTRSASSRSPSCARAAKKELGAEVRHPQVPRRGPGRRRPAARRSGDADRPLDHGGKEVGRSWYHGSRRGLPCRRMIVGSRPRSAGRGIALSMTFTILAAAAGLGARPVAAQAADQPQSAGERGAAEPRRHPAGPRRGCPRRLRRHLDGHRGRERGPGHPRLPAGAERGWLRAAFRSEHDGCRRSDPCLRWRRTIPAASSWPGRGRSRPAPVCSASVSAPEASSWDRRSCCHPRTRAANSRRAWPWRMAAPLSPSGSTTTTATTRLPSPDSPPRASP